jgi:putative hemolysin
MFNLVAPLGGLILLLALSGFFSSSETALMAVSRYRLRYLERRGVRNAEVVRRLVESPESLLSAILLGNNFANIAASSLAAAIAIRSAGDGGLWLATIVMTAAVLIFSEIAPKTIAARDPERLALLVARPIQLTVRLLHPFASAAAGIAGLVIHPIVGASTHSPRVSEEIRGMLEFGEDERGIARERRRMLSSIFSLTETTIEDVMIPRTQVKSVAIDATPEEVLQTLRDSGATRLPVYRSNLDDIVGILHSKDVFRYWKHIADLDIAAIMRKPIYVPETATLETLLRLFRHHRQHLALVIDEYGGVEGIVSLEDLLEEIVGDIEDEHDTPQAPQVIELDDGALLVEGTCPISLLNQRYSLELSARHNTTLAGFLMEWSGGIPQPGDRLTHGELTFNIRRASRNRIDLVRIEGAYADSVDPA